MIDRKYDLGIVWFLSEKCNLRCDYCINSHINNGKLFKVRIKELMNTLDESGKIFSILLTGRRGIDIEMNNIIIFVNIYKF